MNPTLFTSVTLNVSFPVLFRTNVTVAVLPGSTDGVLFDACSVKSDAANTAVATKRIAKKANSAVFPFILPPYILL